jgi:transcription antitermination factor NusG
MLMMEAAVSDFAMFEEGDLVRVMTGPFESFRGVIEEVDETLSRLTVAVLVFGRATRVELEFGQVEKAGRPRAKRRLKPIFH